MENKLIKYRITVYLILVFLNTCNFQSLYSQDNHATFKIKADLFDFSKPETLGLSFIEEAETITIFHPEGESNKYNNGVVLFPFKGLLYVQWQSSTKDEDAPDTKLVYSRSPDGKKWSNPDELVIAAEGTFYTSGGWWSDGKVLIAYINVWPTSTNSSFKGYIQFIKSEDGINWSKPDFVKDIKGEPIDGIFEQDPHAILGGRIISAIHLRPGLKAAPYYTDNPMGVTGWVKGDMENLPFEGKTGRELEPGWFFNSDSAIVMLFRDQKGSFRKLASISYDRGKTWSIPGLTDLADSRSKQCAGNLPDGTAYQINNPSGNKNRWPLVIVLGKDGKLFNSAYLLRAGGEDLQPLRYEGIYKREGYSYPKSIIWNGLLYAGYATNKEDIEVTRVPVKNLLK